MTQAQEILNQSTPDERTANRIEWKSPLIWIGVVALIVVAVLAMMTLNPPKTIDPAPNYYRNPELMVVHRNAELAAPRAEADFLRANPELKLVQPGFSLMTVSQNDFATNPELKAHLRFVEGFDK